MNNKRDAAAMGRRRSIAVAAAVLAGAAGPGIAPAQPSESLIVDVGACVNLDSAGERLDCYEEQVARARARPEAPGQARPAAPAAAPTAPAPAATPSAAAAGTSSAGATVESAIAALRETVPNTWVITLANGQIWRQDFPKAYRLQVGQRVRIAPERRFGGGHRLTVVGMNGFIQVEQVR
jgi:hypothetical protein